MRIFESNIISVIMRGAAGAIPYTNHYAIFIMQYSQLALNMLYLYIQLYTSKQYLVKLISFSSYFILYMAIFIQVSFFVSCYSIPFKART